MGNSLRLDISSKHVSKLFLPVCMYGCLAGATTGTFSNDGNPLETGAGAVS